MLPKSNLMNVNILCLVRFLIWAQNIFSQTIRTLVVTTIVSLVNLCLRFMPMPPIHA